MASSSISEKNAATDNFSHLPRYQPPRSGLVSYFPQSMQPYLQVMRLDRPQASLYFLIPHVVGCVQAGALLRVPAWELVRLNGALALGTFFMRGATVTWNDMADIEFDRQVERTRHRALARGAISYNAALAFTAVQTAGAVAVLALLPPACTVYALPAILGWAVYPFAKRFTDFPQVVLGLPMSWGVLVGAVAAGAEPLGLDRFPHEAIARLANAPMLPEAAGAIMSVWAANWLWNLCYETAYSYQDVRDDKEAGVRNIALLLGQRGGKALMVACSALDLFLVYRAGKLMDAGLPFYLASVGGKAAALAVQIMDVRLSDNESIAWWFRNGGAIAGGAMLSGFVLEYLRRVY